MELSKPSILNIASYAFFDLKDPLPELRHSIKLRAKELGIMGTVLLSPEGINLSLSGEKGGIRAFQDYMGGLFSQERDFEYKESLSSKIAFRRLLVKIKKQIIPATDEKLNPLEKTGIRLCARDLKDWLDRGEEFLLLDTRNDYEVDLGTFEKAEAIGVRHFRHFEEKVRSYLPTHRDKKIVTFCTGGIRCEKASAMMMNQGFESVYQLDGGILKYFEEVGGTHYKGSCFVFDRRIALTPDLKEAGFQDCFVCRHALSPEELKSPNYIQGKQCDYCVSN